MARVFLGIDPGMEGALARVDEYGKQVEIVDMPVLDSGKGGRRLYDEAECARKMKWLHTSAGGCDELIVVIEQVHAMPKQGVVSVFTFGQGFGMLLGIIAALGFRSRRVEPARWKKEVLADGPKTDQAVVAFASRIYPEVGGQLTTPRGRLLLGRADALLIAHWGREAWRAGRI